MCIPLGNNKNTYNNITLKELRKVLDEPSNQEKLEPLDKIKPNNSKDDFQISSKLSKSHGAGNDLTIPLFEDSANQIVKTIKPVTVDDIKAGSILNKDMNGPAVQILKDRLEKFTGTKLPSGDKFDNQTENLVKMVQKNLGICKPNNPNYGKIDKKTWTEINNAVLKFPGNSIPLTKDAQKLADESKLVATNMNTHGNCYAGVWKAIQNRDLDKKMDPPSDHAYQFGDWAMTAEGKKTLSRVMPMLDSSGKITGLKPGDIIVYNRGVNYHSVDSGHIEIYKSDKEFYSDHNSCSYEWGGYNDLLKDINNGDLLNGNVKVFRLNQTKQTENIKKPTLKDLKI